MRIILDAPRHDHRCPDCGECYTHDASAPRSDLAYLRRCAACGFLHMRRIEVAAGGSTRGTTKSL